jgi:hypothetical protein
VQLVNDLPTIHEMEGRPARGELGGRGERVVMRDNLDVASDGRDGKSLSASAGQKDEDERSGEAQRVLEFGENCSREQRKDTSRRAPMTRVANASATGG